MSCLSFPVEELSRLRVCVRVLASGAFSFSVQPSFDIANGSQNIGDPSASCSVVFETSSDGEGHTLQVYTKSNHLAPIVPHQAPVSTSFAPYPGGSVTDHSPNVGQGFEFSNLDMALSDFDFSSLAQSSIPYDSAAFAASSHCEWPSFDQLTGEGHLGDHSNSSSTHIQIVPSDASAIDPDAPVASGSGSPPESTQSHAGIFSDSSDTASPESSSPATPADSPEPPLSSGRRKRTLACPKCPRHFSNEYTLKVHSRTHKPKTPKALPCTMGCNEHFSRQHDRLRHEVVKHNRVCEWVCTHCKKFFSSERTLSNHLCQAPGAPTRWEIN